MKLLQLNVTANWGSTGKIAEGIGLAALSTGWDSHIAYGRYMRSSKSKLKRIGTQREVYSHFVKQRVFDTEGLGSKHATRELIDYINDIEPDIVQLHNIHDHWVNYEILFEFLNQTDIKVVWTLHDCWPFTGHCFYFQSVKCERWKSNCYDCPLVHEYPNTLVDNSSNNFKRKKELFTSNKNLTLVACSEWIAELARQSFFKDYCIRVIRNGIDLNEFNWPNTNSFIYRERGNDSRIILGVASVWEKRKGYNDFVQLSKIIPQHFKIVLVGLTKQQIKNLPDNILGIERTQNVTELAELYSKSLVLVNPTWEDNFPTVSLEALACGTPVITYRTGGSPEAIDDKTGLVVERGDIQGLKIAIDTIECATDRFTHDQCRARAEKYFNKEERFMEYISLYNEILSK